MTSGTTTVYIDGSSVGSNSTSSNTPAGTTGYVGYALSGSPGDAPVMVRWEAMYPSVSGTLTGALSAGATPGGSVWQAPLNAQ